MMDARSLVKPPVSKCMKSGMVMLSPGEEIGSHVTSKREEILVILRGTATVVQSPGGVEEVRTLSAGETHYIGPEIEHNVINRSGSEELEYIYTVCLFNGDQDSHTAHHH